jgi:hypothetical protein
MRLARMVVPSIFAMAALLVILEHAGGFSSVLSQGGSTFATGFQALTGHGANGSSKGVATGYNAGGRHYA